MTKALLVDLNNFGRYPTLAIGYLVASLRAADYDVEVP
jgi:anaerobic magnesium-protoporphyrin IX monomethyl ester cyclase